MSIAPASCSCKQSPFPSLGRPCPIHGEKGKEAWDRLETLAYGNKSRIYIDLTAEEIRCQIDKGTPKEDNWTAEDYACWEDGNIKIREALNLANHADE